MVRQLPQGQALLAGSALRTSLLQSDDDRAFTFVYDDHIDPLRAIRFCGGTEALNNKTFTMPDFESAT
ncbi:hypothetical protein ACXPWS_22760 [Mycobacterium sp. BMJ-28]